MPEPRRPLRLLVLGGTTEASALARTLAGRTDIKPLLSMAGRTEKPIAPPIPYRIGGFGGAEGLANFLRSEGIEAVVDATHPFAARISANAVAACHAARVPLAVFSRPAWSPEPLPSMQGAQPTKQPSAAAALGCFAPFAMTDGGDRWISVADIAAAVAALNGPPRRVFLTTGRLDLRCFQAAPQHCYLIRTIDPPDPADLPPVAEVVLARPPFAVEDEIALMRAHGIDLLVTKNSGGAAGAAKLAAARRLGMPVIMIERPPPSGALELNGLEAVLAWIEAQRP